MSRAVKRPLLMQPIRKSLVCLAIGALLPLSALADKTDDIVNSGQSRLKAGASSQKRIDDLSEATEKIVSQYHQESKIVEGLKVYNDRLNRTLTAQKEGMAKLSKSIEDASLIERQIVPLMLRMIDGLDKFVAADLPFKLDDRKGRIERIKGYLTNANVSASERFRQVLEAYSTESTYGKTINVYTDTLALESGDLTVNLLQVGRTGLFYQTLDGSVSGFWDKASNAWKKLDSSHNAGIDRAIRITQGKDNPDLMDLPLTAPEVL